MATPTPHPPTASRAMRRLRRYHHFLPAVALVLIVALGLLTGTVIVLLAFVITAPLLAASFLPAKTTAVYGGLALAIGALMGAVLDQYRLAFTTQIVRLSIIVVCAGLAVLTAHARTGREERLRRVTRIAEIAQSAILPPIPARIGPLNVAASYDSAEAEADVGGDAYAAFSTVFGVRLLMADVRGHGLEAVHLAATVIGAFRERAHERADLSELARDLDRGVARAGGDEDFVTAVLAEVDDDELRIVNAGHVAPLLVRAGVTIDLTPLKPAVPLGLGTDAEPVQIVLEPGDRLLLYTDGVTEARGPGDGEFFPLSRLAAPCLGTGSLPQGLATLRTALADWVRGPVSDDVTLLAFEFAPAHPGASALHRAQDATSPSAHASRHASPPATSDAHHRAPAAATSMSSQALENS